MFSLRYILLIGINTIGVFASLFSLIHTERLSNFIFDHNLVCDINNAISCSATYISDYAFVFDIPVSLFALIFFWFVLSVVLLNKPKEDETFAYPLLGVINGIAMFVCAYFLYILLFVLGNICISCIIVDLMVLINVVILYSDSKRIFTNSNHPIRQLYVKNRLMLLSFVLLLATGLGLYKVYQLTVFRKNMILLEAFYRQKPVDIVTDNNPIVWGNKDGKVEIKIFNDFLI